MSFCLASGLLRNGILILRELDGTQVGGDDAPTMTSTTDRSTRIMHAPEFDLEDEWLSDP